METTRHKSGDVLKWLCRARQNPGWTRAACRQSGYAYLSAVLVLIPIAWACVVAIRPRGVAALIAAGPVVRLERARLVVASALVASLIGLPQRIILALVSCKQPLQCLLPPWGRLCVRRYGES